MLNISEKWDKLLKKEYESDYFKELEIFLDKRYKSTIVYPQKENIYRAFLLCPPDEVKVVILGQDPYINEGEADGLAFSANIKKLPPSLKNIYKELETDLGISRESGDLTDLAKKGVLLLNRTLTVDKGESKSHSNMGWERFTKAVISTLNQKFENIVFILWGNDARSLKGVIDAHRHFIIEGVHPSPLSSYRGFFGSKPFSKSNEYLLKNGKKVIDWSQNE